MGFAKPIAEKAVYMVKAAGVDLALDWIEKNKERADYNLSLKELYEKQQQKKREAKLNRKLIESELRKLHAAELEQKKKLEAEKKRV